jgi:hypothetical protein
MKITGLENYKARSCKLCEILAAGDYYIDWREAEDVDKLISALVDEILEANKILKPAETLTVELWQTTQK